MNMWYYYYVKSTACPFLIKKVQGNSNYTQCGDCVDDCCTRIWWLAVEHSIYFKNKKAILEISLF